MEDEIKIMLVEPDVRTREVYCEVVAGQKGMKLVFATDQQAQAVDYLRTQEVDVVIMEMELAEGDGIGLLDEIEAVPEIKPLRSIALDARYFVSPSHKPKYVFAPIHKLKSAFSSWSAFGTKWSGAVRVPRMRGCRA